MVIKGNNIAVYDLSSVSRTIIISVYIITPVINIEIDGEIKKVDPSLQANISAMR